MGLVTVWAVTRTAPLSCVVLRQWALLSAGVRKARMSRRTDFARHNTQHGTEGGRVVGNPQYDVLKHRPHTVAVPVRTCAVALRLGQVAAKAAHKWPHYRTVPPTTCTALRHAVAIHYAYSCLVRLGAPEKMTHTTLCTHAPWKLWPNTHVTSVFATPFPPHTTTKTPSGRPSHQLASSFFRADDNREERRLRHASKAGSPAPVPLREPTVSPPLSSSPTSTRPMYCAA